MDSTLKKYFGFSNFRPYQKEIVENILQGKDCVVVMATGSGKSLCYQVPPLIAQKTAVVVSPLISLMQDQVMALQQRGILADHLSSAQSDPNVQTKAESGQYDILYMTPEKACLLPVSFWARLLDSGVCLFAVDEAHCISEWGHDFRMEYKQMDRLRDVLLDVPFVALTATATEKVRLDIVKSLKMLCPFVTIGTFNRGNLFYSAKSFKRSDAFLNELVTEIIACVKAGSTIIYCSTVKDVEQICASLKEAGIEAGMYHGQMSKKSREDCHRSFIRDEFYVMVATIAFGMGIDKPNIRHVIHYGCPKSLESYYQESGRCGRDGIPSFCRLYYARSDFGKGDFYCSEARTDEQRKAIMESFISVQRYCMLTTCRRKFLLEYFGEKCPSDKCGACDNCTSSRKESDMSRMAFLLMACIRSCGGSWGLNLPVDVLRGSRSKKIIDANFNKLPFHGLGKEMPANWWKALAYQLISQDYLLETFQDVYKTVRLGPKGVQFLNSCSPDHMPPLYLTLTPELVGDNTTKDAVDEAGGSLTQLQVAGLSKHEDQFYKMLVEERLKLARDHGTAPYAICGDQTLRRIALTRPSTRARLANIDGVNQYLLKTYGDRLLLVIQHLSQELGLSLDGELPAEPTKVAPDNSEKIGAVTVHNNNRLTPAKLEAWKMWQENGLTIQQIANHPGRGGPIKEQTVFSYILEAGQGGCSVDWGRFCLEIGLTQEICKSVQDAVAKVGKGKLKPIKNELADEIKLWLEMEEMGLSTGITPASHQQQQQQQQEESLNETSKPSVQSKQSQPNLDHIPSRESEEPAVAVTEDDPTRITKRQKLDVQQMEQSVPMEEEEATESSILDWLSNFEQGATVSELLQHFKGSKQETLSRVLEQMEGDFLIFKKNNVYKLM
ncbi:uncharacterized protein LOC127258666 isoform X2 [Andrographis paniculata]|uniref:uncharacterized protein LOC127258666 isoform X2 n=1 Tax=Andrographis paniculata TaxID=175694 RepID=UPI0021E813EB|nr:uncharacterized protein LOC127258666 isoform X2 [Andrographis paniculata]